MLISLIRLCEDLRSFLTMPSKYIFDCISKGLMDMYLGRCETKLECTRIDAEHRLRVYVAIPLMRPLPPLLHSPYNTDIGLARHFRTRITQL